MLGRLVASAIAFVGLTGVAFAQTSTQSPSSSSITANTTGSSSTSQAGAANSVPQEIQSRLTAKGFSDVKVVPGSYLVSAKDKDGDSVTMIIGPHSMTMFTLEQAQAPAGKQ